jgi:hypothetical protein
VKWCNLPFYTTILFVETKYQCMKKYFTTLIFSACILTTFAQINVGLVGKFYFNSGNSQSDVDSTVLDNIAGTAPSLTADRFGNANKAYQFNGIDNYFFYASQLSGASEQTKLNIDDYNAMSLSVWIYPTFLSGNQCIVSRWNASPLTEQFLLELQGNKILVAIRTVNSSGYVDTTTLQNNKWYHIVFTYEKQNNRHKIYVNGQLKSEVTYSGSYTNISSQLAPLTVGVRAAGSQSTFSGKIDDIAFYNRALTDAEVNCLYNEPNPTTPLSDPVAVTVSASASEVCNGNPVTISASATGPVTNYQWNWNVFSSDTGGTVIPQSTTTYQVIVRDSTSCRSASASVTVTVNPLPPAPVIGYDDQNNFLLITANPTASYQWQLNGTDIPGANGIAYNNPQPGIYTVVGTNDNGCSSTSAPFNFSGGGVGIGEIADFRSVIFPNPTTALLNIESDEPLEAITVTDVFGRLVLHQYRIQNFSSKIDVSGLAVSTYFIHIKTISGKSVVKNFVKQ